MEALFRLVLHCILRKFRYLQKITVAYYPLELFPKLRTARPLQFIAEVVKLCLQHDFVARVNLRQLMTTAKTNLARYELLDARSH